MVLTFLRFKGQQTLDLAPPAALHCLESRAHHPLFPCPGELPVYLIFLCVSHLPLDQSFPDVCFDISYREGWVFLSFDPSCPVLPIVEPSLCSYHFSSRLQALWGILLHCWFHHGNVMLTQLWRLDFESGSLKTKEFAEFVKHLSSSQLENLYSSTVGLVKVIGLTFRDQHLCAGIVPQLLEHYLI